MLCVMDREFSIRIYNRERIDLGCNDKSDTQDGSCEFSDEDTSECLTPEREAEIIANLGNLGGDLDYPILWRLPDGTRVKV